MKKNNYTYNTIPQTKYFNTGFLDNTSEERILQGLQPQEISNNCQYLLPGMKNENELVRDGGVYKSSLLYNFPVTQLKYNNINIKNNCSCLMYLQSP
jgi:hypothetical protein